MATPAKAQPGGTSNQADFDVAALGDGATPGPTQAKADPSSLYQGYKTPFRREEVKPDTVGRVIKGIATSWLSELKRHQDGPKYRYLDANNQEVPEGIYNAWLAAGSPKPVPTPAKPTVPRDPTKPTGADQDAAVQKIIDASNLPAPDYDGMAEIPKPPAPTEVAKAGQTTIDTTQSNETRGQQQENIADLQKAARGQGPAADLARARLAQALRRSGAQVAGMVQGATGQNRKAALLQAALAGNEAALNAGEQVAVIEAQDRQQAQIQLGNVLQGVRGQDIGLATSQAGLNQETELFNTGATNDATQRDADRDLSYTEFMATYRIALEDLRLRVEKFKTDAAQGVLTEASRQEGIKMAREGLRLATIRLEKIEIPGAERAAAEADRDFWLKALETLVSVGTKVAAAAAHGGVVTKPTKMLVGEAGPEIIIPVNDVPSRLAKALAVDRKPFDRKDAPDLGVLLAALKGMRQEDGPSTAALPPKVVLLLAAANNAARKKAIR